MKPMLFVLLALNAISCIHDTFDDRIVIKNQSNEKIYYVKCPKETLVSMYRDEIKRQGVPDTYTITYLNYVAEVRPRGLKRERKMGSRTVWESYINDVCEGGKLRIFTFSIDTLKKYSWKDVNENNRYLKKLEFSVDDLEKQNWEIKLP